MFERVKIRRRAAEVYKADLYGWLGDMCSAWLSSQLRMSNARTKLWVRLFNRPRFAWTVPFVTVYPWRMEILDIWLTNPPLEDFKLTGQPDTVLRGLYV